MGDTRTQAGRGSSEGSAFDFRGVDRPDVVLVATPDGGRFELSDAARRRRCHRVNRRWCSCAE
jgi:hypothetical protein